MTKPESPQDAGREGCAIKLHQQLAGAGLQLLLGKPHHRNDGFCIRWGLQNQVSTEQQPQVHFSPLFTAFMLDKPPVQSISPS